MANNSKAASVKKIAMLVSNPCDPDYRVVKQAESLVKAGFEVRVFCTWKVGLGIPTFEVINGVTYVRREWNPLNLLIHRYLGSARYPGIPRLDREKHRKITERSAPRE